MNSDDDYRPEEDPDDSDPDDNEEGDVGLELLGQDFDEEAYLRGSFSGAGSNDTSQTTGTPLLDAKTTQRTASRAGVYF